VVKTRLKRVVWAGMILALLQAEMPARNASGGAMAGTQTQDYEGAFNDIVAWCKKKPNDKNGQESVHEIVPRAFEYFLSVGREAEARKDWDAAIEAYNKCFLLENRLKLLPPLYGEDGSEVPPPQAPVDCLGLLQAKKVQAAQYYFEIAALAESKQEFQQAADNYRKCSSFQDNFQDSLTKEEACRRQQKETEAESLYRQASDCYQKRLFREAYYLFESCLKVLPDYKDAAGLKSDSLAKGEIRIVVFPVSSSIRFFPVAQDLCKSVSATTEAGKNPFVRIVDMESLLGPAGVADPGRFPSIDVLIQHGREIGLDVLVICEVSGVDESVQPQECQNRTAYQWELKSVDGKQLYESIPVEYIHCRRSAKLQLQAQYRLIEIRSPQEPESRPLLREREETIEYASCQGCKTDWLYHKPAPPRANQVLAEVVTTMLGREKIDPQLFAAPSEFRPLIDRVTELSPGLADEITTGFLQFINDHLQKQVCDSKPFLISAESDAATGASVQTGSKPVVEGAPPSDPRSPTFREPLAVELPTEVSAPPALDTPAATDSHRHGDSGPGGEAATKPPQSAAPSASAKASVRKEVPASDPNRATIIRVNGALVTLNRGSNHGVRIGLKVVLFADADDTKVCGEGYVTALQENSCVIRLRTNRGGGPQAGMHARILKE